MDDQNNPIACEEYAARLEDLLESGEAQPAAELAAHLGRCAACREAFEVARLSQALLRGGLEPAPQPGGAFATRVIARIREEEGSGQQFWRPLERLASRLALAAAMALLVLTVYLFEFAPPRNRGPVVTQAEATEGFPQPAEQPTSKDEILLTLAESNHGR